MFHYDAVHDRDKHARMSVLTCLCAVIHVHYSRAISHYAGKCHSVSQLVSHPSPFLTRESDMYSYTPR